MRKFTIATVPAFVLALALSAAAQEKPIMTNKEMKDTLKASVSGAVVLDYVWRSSEITAFTDSFSGVKNNPGGTPPPPPPGTPADADAESTFEGHLAIRMDIDLNDKVAAVIEFGTKRVDGGFINKWGNSTAEDIQLREARVVISDFLTQGLKLGVGLPDWSFDVRGKGSSMAFDPRHSQSALRNSGTVQDGAGSLAARAGFPEEMEPVGFWLGWTNQQITLEFVALMAVIEGGSASQDEALYAVDFWYALDQIGKGSKVGAILALGTGPGAHTSVYTFGGGADIKLMDGNLDVYAEFYVQFGEAGRNATGENDASGSAFQIGGTYTIPNNNIWFGANLTYFSGDGDTLATDDSVDRFMGYESVSDLMILEDMYFGFDWDSNYMAFKFSGGVALSLGAGKDNLRLSGIVGFARTLEDVFFTAAAGGPQDGLGTEVDLKAQWVLTKQASLNFAIAFLFGSDVLEASMGGSASPDAEDNASLFTFGADLRF